MRIESKSRHWGSIKERLWPGFEAARDCHIIRGHGGMVCAMNLYGSFPPRRELVMAAGDGVLLVSAGWRAQGGDVGLLWSPSPDMMLLLHANPRTPPPRLSAFRATERRTGSYALVLESPTAATTTSVRPYLTMDAS